jgi:hypothetical protein
LVAVAEESASLRISSATTANPRPCSPARAASGGEARSRRHAIAHVEEVPAIERLDRREQPDRHHRDRSDEVFELLRGIGSEHRGDDDRRGDGDERREPQRTLERAYAQREEPFGIHAGHARLTGDLRV